MSTADPTGPLEVALAHTARLLRSAPKLAAEQASEILKAVPSHPLASLHLGTARRLCGEPAAALEVLTPLCAAHAQWAPAHAERGLALAEAGKSAEAIIALRRAVALTPLMPDAWRVLADLLTLQGDFAAADVAYAQHIKASTRDPRLLAPAAALVEGRVAQAEQLLRAHLKQFPTDVAALRMLAEVAARLNRNADAEALLSRCLELAPSFAAARNQYAIILQRQHKYAAALQEIDLLLQSDPRNSAYQNTRAVILGKIGEYETSLDIYAGILAANPQHAKIWLSYGHTLATQGRQADSIAAYRTSIRLMPELGEAYWSLANLKTFRFAPEEIEAMRGQSSRSDLSTENRLHFDFALGKALEDAGDYTGSFALYCKANALRRQGIHYDAEETSSFVHRSKALFDKAFFASRAGYGSPTPDPIFILGLPRAGSTLIEQMLASHSAVEGTMELPDILMLSGGLSTEPKSSNERPYPGVLAGLTRAQCMSLGQQYLDQTRIQRKTTKPFFIDKMPINFLHVGLIHLMLPNARIIDARRHPLACCFSAFKMQFAEGHRYAFDLREIARFYRDYVQLMQHFDAVLPGRIHRVHYESMIDDTEAEVRRLLAYCGLPYETACLRFHENKRAVRTASAQQVRQPLFRAGVEQWRHYEPWLGTLKAELAEVLERYPMTAEF